ncbi:UDP-2,3-diacylglucosamine diphosphatase LpxI [Hyphomicrobium sp. CS1GBMeth3]|uniref:UDP-2,3-diacylglucosamine diphosphatase LpxI domain-containing protein n=1 Tax=Hyphomicrobium sp. CS1GBMeth3 TaxID=1892845 RepID=UPI00092FE179|nr:UDP-2,3-diacylglucosamine diphosphatase LpxI [Hyphomicrobium sp. CS1GBMeth3]
MTSGIRRLGILAGGGGVPREIADSAASRGLPVSIVAIDGEADADFGPHPVTVVNWGQIGAMVRALKTAGTTDLVIVGRVHRPELSGLKPDLGFFRYLPKLIRIVASGGDDSVLRRVVRFFEEQGLRVIGPGDAAPEIVVHKGPFGGERAAPEDAADINKGLSVVRALGSYDIGQSVIVRGGRVLAIEGAEGTDRMLARAARTAGEGSTTRGVLVKRSKPSQDLRVDMPAIGPATIDGVRAAGLAGIAVEAEKVLVADRAETLQRADAAHVFVEGVIDQEVTENLRKFDPRSIAMGFRCLGRANPVPHATLDAIKAAKTIEALAPFAVGRAVVVVRNHVLSVEAGNEGVGATIERATNLRQWASLTHRRRGVVGLRNFDDLTPGAISDAGAAGYAGIVIADVAPQGAGGSRELIEAADKTGIFIVQRIGAGGSAHE